MDTGLKGGVYVSDRKKASWFERETLVGKTDVNKMEKHGSE